MEARPAAFTKRYDREEIPYVLELLECVGDQRATETAHRAWLLTRRDRADAIAEIRILLAHAEELAEPTEFIDEDDEF